MGRKDLTLALSLLCYVCSVCSEDNLNGLTSTLPKHSIVQPQLIHRSARSIHKLEDKDSGEVIKYSIQINNKKHQLHLERNRDFLHPNLFSDDESNKPPVHCYYHGEVEGSENSLVALSTCSGLRGVIVLENETFGLEPLPGSNSNEHVLYLLRDVQSKPVTCGVVGEDGATANQRDFEPGHTLTSLLRKKRNLPTTSYIELALVVDNLRYILKKQNMTAVREEMVELANLVDGYYKQLNIRVMLVGLEVFKDSNPFSVDGSAGEVLKSFVKWRQENLLPRLRNDMGQFIIGRSRVYDGGILGMAFVGTVCSVANSGGINVFSNDSSLPYISAVVAHEMGHNLGMNHDNNRCSCDGGSCIMDASATGSTKFSTCSGNDFENLILRGGGACLKNVPSHSEVIGIAKCGNGLLEDGEQCDCGTPVECKNKCCDAATCKFTKGSVCAAGRCCQDCQLNVAGTPCRGSENACDLPEYCNGTSAFCPDDFYLMDGLSCLNSAAYCYEGRCQTYDFQCKQLFAPNPATKAADICFQTNNLVGDKFGNCGMTSNGQYIKCSTANALCGKVQCTNVDVNNPPPGATVSNQIINGSKCVNVDFNLGSDVLDPGYSKQGSPCAKDMACVDFKCVNASALLPPNLTCDAQATCYGRGVCNNRGHCHCNDGWAPPDCSRLGRGGSIDSGPAQIDYSLRNGLLVFFLLVVPLLVLAVFLYLYIFKRDTLNHCLKRRRRHKSQPTGNGTTATTRQTNVNVPVHTGTQLPVEPPAERPGYPPSTAVDGWRYGELNYWKEEHQGPQAPVPAPRQGPGVPKPIPARQPPNLDD